MANLLLQILEDGQLTDAYGNQVDFRNTLVLMTSNIGSKLVLRGGRMGFGEGSEEASFQRIEEEILAELRRTFSPEFINRIDEVIVFNPLGEDELRSIVDILLEDVNNTLAERSLRLEVSEPAKEWLLAKAGVEPVDRGPAVAPDHPAPHPGRGLGDPDQSTSTASRSNGSTWIWRAVS